MDGTMQRDPNPNDRHINNPCATMREPSCPDVTIKIETSMETAPLPPPAPPVSHPRTRSGLRTLSASSPSAPQPQQKRARTTVRSSHADDRKASASSLATQEQQQQQQRRSVAAQQDYQPPFTALRSSGRSTPQRSSGGSRKPVKTSPGSSLHRVAQGRVERRSSRRSELKDALGRLQGEQRREDGGVAKAEIARLKALVQARDREIYELQNATVVIDTERIWSLEQQVERLKAQLARQHAPNTQGDAIARSDNGPGSWKTKAAGLQVGTDDACLEMDTGAEQQAGDSTAARAGSGTPERSNRSSFLTPPQTSPRAPATPCMRFSLPMAMVDAGVHAEVPDPAKETLEIELSSVNETMARLTAKLDEYSGLSDRLRSLLAAVPSGTMSEAEPSSRPTSTSTKAIEDQVRSLVITLASQGADLDRLSTAVAGLGFMGADALEMVSSLNSGFRAARLELEYLTPGEISLPLTSHGAEILDLLLDRLRLLARKAKDDEAAMDTYHELEQSLRSQVALQASKLNMLKSQMGRAQDFMDSRDRRIRELEAEVIRLRDASAAAAAATGEMVNQDDRGAQQQDTTRPEAANCPELEMTMDGGEVKGEVKEEAKREVKRSKRIMARGSS